MRSPALRHIIHPATPSSMTQTCDTISSPSPTRNIKNNYENYTLTRKFPFLSQQQTLTWKLLILSHSFSPWV